MEANWYIFVFIYFFNDAVNIATYKASTGETVSS